LVIGHSPSATIDAGHCCFALERGRRSIPSTFLQNNFGKFLTSNFYCNNLNSECQLRRKHQALSGALAPGSR
jgi:hypothetical protein